MDILTSVADMVFRVADMVIADMVWFVPEMDVILPQIVLRS